MNFKTILIHEKIEFFIIIYFAILYKFLSYLKSPGDKIKSKFNAHPDFLLNKFYWHFFQYYLVCSENTGCVMRNHNDAKREI